MDEALAMAVNRTEQDRRIAEIFEAEKRNLSAFIRRRVPDEIDPEDLLQDVFSELVEAYRLMKPIAHAGAWMMQVARNRITDLFRRKRPEADSSADRLILEDLLPSPDAGPDALYARGILMGEIEAALAELPASQRDVFIGHEIEGRSFAEMAGESGVSVNTLLSRKHYAVRHLRRRLQEIYNEFKGEKE
jgi:RNA polymerase sigma factor (sigma-70 family)